MKQKVLHDLKGAMVMLEQAQRSAPSQSDLWNEMNEIWERMDMMSDLLQASKNEFYDEEGQLHD